MIEALGLRKIYKDGFSQLEVLKGVSLKAVKAQITAILGPSGAGKSSLLHILGGLDSPSEGKVFIAGEDIYSLGDGKLARLRNKKIGFVFQFFHLLPEFNALENVLLPLWIKGERTEHSRRKGIDMLNMVGLSERLRHRPGQLSGGEQQRVAIARALINEPEALLCDEPTGNLDSDTGGNIMDLLWNLNKKQRMTMVIVTHEERLANMAHNCLHIKDGKIGD